MVQRGCVCRGCVREWPPGVAGFYRDTGLKSRHKGRIWGVYVTPTKRVAGVGRRLLQSLLERAQKIEGMEQILLSVTKPQTAAIGLYRSLGFESFGSEPRALRIGDRWIDEEYMILRLNHRSAGSPVDGQEEEKAP